MQLSDLGAPLIQNYDAKIYKAHSQSWAALQDQRGVMYFREFTRYLGIRWSALAQFDNHWKSYGALSAYGE